MELKLLQKIEYACAALLLIAVVLLVGVASVARAMGSPIIWSIEVAQLLFLWLCIVAIDLGLQQNRHFGLSVLLDKLPATGRKYLELFNQLVLIGLLLFLIHYAWENMLLMHPRLTGALQMHGSYFHASMFVGFILMLRTLAVQFIGNLRKKANS